MEEIKVRMCYEHVTGAVYYCAGIAKEIKEKDGEQAIMILLENASMYVTPVSTFFDKHPQTGVPRFQLCTPIVKIVK